MNTVTKWLTRDSVVLGLKATDAKHLCGEVAKFVAHRQNLDENVIFRALWRREQCGSTGLGHGIAIPHARIPGISDPVVLFARTRDPIPFDSPDRQPVSAFFVILVPEHANEDHLRILATVSEMFSDKKFRRQLEVETDAAAIQRLFGNWAGESDLGAPKRLRAI